MECTEVGEENLRTNSIYFEIDFCIGAQDFKGFTQTAGLEWSHENLIIILPCIVPIVRVDFYWIAVFG